MIFICLKQHTHYDNQATTPPKYGITSSYNPPDIETYYVYYGRVLSIQNNTDIVEMSTVHSHGWTPDNRQHNLPCM